MASFLDTYGYLSPDYPSVASLTPADFPVSRQGQGAFLAYRIDTSS